MIAVFKSQAGRLCLLLSIVFCLAITISAQVTTADMVGTVTDNAGAVLPNAKVTVTNTGTNSARTVTTDDSGAFTVNLLPIGIYSVKVEAAGFKGFAVSGITLVGGDRTRVDAKLKSARLRKPSISRQTLRFCKQILPPSGLRSLASSFRICR